ncbi:MAG: nucleotide exchange factor GrpE [Deltaproteobacteria bacterium]|nr:nucleotide exchange factor GrpE [Deltaproteobacteria bacterium]
MSKGKRADPGPGDVQAPDASTLSLPSPDVEPDEAGGAVAPPAESPPLAVDEGAEEPEARVLAEMESRLRRVSSAYQELQSEMSAFRERTERLQDERERHQRARVVTTVFEPMQNLRRSIEALSRMEVPAEVIQGFQLILEQFQAALKDLGLEEISTAGVPFDPGLHEALATVDVPMAGMDGMVVQVFDVGYRIGTHLVQPARVVIGRYREVADPPTPGEE